MQVYSATTVPFSVSDAGARSSQTVLFATVSPPMLNASASNKPVSSAFVTVVLYFALTLLKFLIVIVKVTLSPGVILVSVISFPLKDANPPFANIFPLAALVATLIEPSSAIVVGEYASKSLIVASIFTLPEVTAMFTSALLVNNANVAPTMRLAQRQIAKIAEMITLLFDDLVIVVSPISNFFIFILKFCHVCGFINPKRDVERFRPIIVVEW